MLAFLASVWTPYEPRDHWHLSETAKLKFSTKFTTEMNLRHKNIFAEWYFIIRQSSWTVFGENINWRFKWKNQLNKKIRNLKSEDIQMNFVRALFSFHIKDLPIQSGRHTWIPCQMIHHQERMSHYFGICKTDYCLSRVFSCTAECFGHLFHYNHRPFDNFDFHHRYCTLTRANQFCMSMFRHRCSRTIHYRHYHNHMVYTIQQMSYSYWYQESTLECNCHNFCLKLKSSKILHESSKFLKLWESIRPNRMRRWKTLTRFNKTTKMYILFSYWIR